ncbi:MAG: hypothetical protein ACE5Q6_04680 [Dehalococcoidia bacterium]
MTAYTIVNGWQSTPATDEPSWQLTTEQFTFEGNPWALIWSLQGAELKVTVNHSDGRPPVLIHVVGDVPNGAQGVSYIFDSGTFNLDIDAQGQWTIKLVAIDNQDLDLPEDLGSET